MVPSIFRKLDVTDSADYAVFMRSKDVTVFSLHDFFMEETEASFSPVLLQRLLNLIEAYLIKNIVARSSVLYSPRFSPGT
jgi:hypothetical protein